MGGSLEFSTGVLYRCSLTHVPSTLANAAGDVFPGPLELTTDDQWANSIQSKGMVQINLVHGLRTNCISPLVLARSVAYHAYFTGFIPVPAREVGQAYLRDVNADHRAHPQAAQHILLTRPSYDWASVLGCDTLITGLGDSRIIAYA
jgi:hypothetical protein